MAYSCGVDLLSMRSIAVFFAFVSASSFPSISACPGIHINSNWRCKVVPFWFENNLIPTRTIDPLYTARSHLTPPSEDGFTKNIVQTSHNNYLPAHHRRYVRSLVIASMLSRMSLIIVCPDCLRGWSIAFIAAWLSMYMRQIRYSQWFHICLIARCTQIWLPSRAVLANTCSRTVLASPEQPSSHSWSGI